MGNVDLTAQRFGDQLRRSGVLVQSIALFHVDTTGLTPEQKRGLPYDTVILCSRGSSRVAVALAGVSSWRPDQNLTGDQQTRLGVKLATVFTVTSAADVLALL